MLAMAAAYAPPVNSAALSNLFPSDLADRLPKKIPSMNDLPWNVRRKKERDYRRFRRDAATVHRELGIAEGSTYEEVEAAFKTMINAAAGNRKKQIKLEMAKDRIFEIQLQERIAGFSQQTTAARAASNADDGDIEEAKEPEIEKVKKSFSLVPKWARGIIVPPDAYWRERQLKIWMFMSSVTFVLPTLAEVMSIGQILIFLGQMINRGMSREEIGGGGFSPFAGGSGAKGHKKYAVLLASIGWILAKGFGFLLTPEVLRGNKWSPSITIFIENMLIMTTCMFIKVKKD